MAACSPGDKVICPIKDGKIVSVYEMNYDSKEIFEVICIYQEGYLIYIPEIFSIQDTIYIDINNYKYYGLETKYINSEICWISDYKISDIHSKLDGMRCRKCNDFFPMASSNKDDGTFLCWNCKAYPIYN